MGIITKMGGPEERMLDEMRKHRGQRKEVTYHFMAVCLSSQVLRAKGCAVTVGLRNRRYMSGEHLRPKPWAT